MSDKSERATIIVRFYEQKSDNVKEQKYRGNYGVGDNDNADADDVPDSMVLASGHCPLDKCQHC